MGASTAAAEWRSHWTLAVASALGYSAAVLHTYSMGAFMAPLQQEFGWSRAQISLGITIAGIAAAVFSVPVGMAVDRFGPRRIGLTGVVLMTAAFALLGTATGTEANWYLLWSFLAFANLWLQSTVWTSAVATRFERSRGLAFAIAFSGASISATLFPWLAVRLIESYGWRTAFEAMGGIWLLVTLPFMLIFFRGARDTGPRVPKQVAASVADLPGLSVPEALRTRAFYLLMLASVLFTFTGVGTMLHFVPILVDRGAPDQLTAAKIAGLIGIASIVGRLGTGFLLDRFRANLVGAVAFLLPIVASLLLIFNGADPLVQSFAAICFGLTVGAEVDVLGYLASRHFGLRNFGVLFGAVVGALGLGSAFGPLAAGKAFDWYGTYEQFLFLTIVAMAVSCLALVILGRPRFAAAGHGAEPVPIEA